MQNAHDISNRTKNNPNTYTDPRRPLIAKAVLRKRNKAGGFMFPDFRVYYSYSKQNSILLAQKQIHRSVKQNIKARNRLTHLWLINLPQRRQKYAIANDSLFNKWCWGIAQLHLKEGNWNIFFHIIYINRLKFD